MNEPAPAGGAGDIVVGPVPPGADPVEYDRLRRRVLWALPTGLYVVGSRAVLDGDDRCNLMTASLVVQVAVVPKLVGVAVDSTAVTQQLITAGGRFTISLLRRDDRVVVRRFVKPVTDIVTSADGAIVEMAGQPVVLRGGGVPALRSALAVLECELRHRLDLGSHVLFIGEVVQVDGPGEGEVLEVLRMEDTRMSYGG
jgi:flavin reductase (DIM6/NTAB) family NADH-FMN oxidoreductase RutF